MGEIRARYLAQEDGDTHKAAVALARDLMRGDSATFQAGYTAENAVLAAAEVFGLSRDEIMAEIGGNA